MLDITAIRAQFPALTQQINQAPLVYLDSAATTQKPQCVIDTLSHYYSTHNANVHRGSHALTAQATSQFEAARHCVAQFIGAEQSRNIIWTRGATEALNLIAQSYARNILLPGDEILLCETEHHANIVPWQMVAQQTGAKVVKIPMTEQGEFDLNVFYQQLTPQCKIISLAHVTNVTGARNPIESVIEAAHHIGAIVVVDGAQGIVHEKVNVAELDADFYVFSGHKLYAPTGIGVLYGKTDLLNSMPPWHGGGKMVDKVSFSGTTYAGLPGKFEAGTPNVAGALALACAIEWYQSFPKAAVLQHLHELQSKTYAALCEIEDIKVIGYQPQSSIISFILQGVHHQDVATLLDQQGIAVRAGHHCAHPLMEAFGLQGTVRISFGIYNNLQDVDRFIHALHKAVEIL
ncbi:cysteine desulfurase CsdA [Vibrio cincinnatiensis]|uniref:Probable cysteine desulfurase n=1 Tax=Vibrio cincinnatiensis DSM 19608 TaxID=1123491 RepID=A0A1T4N7I4_VIBCI|nr:cysteine desulfurase CsdA [Vibrio cincinnatiensis]MCG3765977.1 cysteine desulfurase CsdA [Vibrio cincinnatiensis]SJZ75085.1 cysteine desulfurase [Vibrio cincinnatiensis DSM 19608]SUP49185.1 class V aminotransferase [Vibrio cincinnatiensis]